jgi:hypothetical protein
MALWAFPVKFLVHHNLMTQMLCKLVFGDGKVLALKSSCDELLDFPVATLDASNVIMKLLSSRE